MKNNLKLVNSLIEGTTYEEEYFKFRCSVSNGQITKPKYTKKILEEF